MNRDSSPRRRDGGGGRICAGAQEDGRNAEAEQARVRAMAGGSDRGIGEWFPRAAESAAASETRRSPCGGASRDRDTITTKDLFRRAKRLSKASRRRRGRERSFAPDSATACSTWPAGILLSPEQIEFLTPHLCHVAIAVVERPLPLQSGRESRCVAGAGQWVGDRQRATAGCVRAARPHWRFGDALEGVSATRHFC